MVASDKRLCSGRVTKWTYQGAYSRPFQAIVFRRYLCSDNTFKVVGINEIPAGAANTPVEYTVPEADRITVQNGDVIGWSFGEGLIEYNYGGTANVQFIHNTNLHASLVTGLTVDFKRVQKREYSIHATVESYEAGTIYSYL